MAVPKSKTSRSKRGMRRSSFAHQLRRVTIATCNQCHEPVRPHCICSCGYYGSKMVVEKKAKATETASKST